MTRRANAQVDELANLKKVVTAVRHPSAVTAMNEEVFYSARQAERHDAMFNASVTALLEALAAIEAQIARLDQQLKELARRSQVCWRL